MPGQSNTEVDRLRDAIAETFPDHPVRVTAASLVAPIAARFEEGAPHVSLGEALEMAGASGDDGMREVFAALAFLSTSTVAVLDVGGINADGSPLDREEFSRRVTTGDRNDSTYIVYRPMPHFAAAIRGESHADPQV